MLNLFLYFFSSARVSEEAPHTAPISGTWNQETMSLSAFDPVEASASIIRKISVSIFFRDSLIAKDLPGLSSVRNCQDKPVSEFSRNDSANSIELSVEQESAINRDILDIGYSDSEISVSFLIIEEDSFLIGRRMKISGGSSRGVGRIKFDVCEMALR